jgi:hypothetical protein
MSTVVPSTASMCLQAFCAAPEDNRFRCLGQYKHNAVKNGSF